jgi:uncharacterized protein YutE (UPF0331/DUF86 family)
MTPADIDRKVVTQRAAWILEMIGALRDLPLKNRGGFVQNRHNVAAAESYLRRSLEALFDIGRHILAKRFAMPATEYKEIARGLLDKKILNEEEAELMRKMAGYRNRMVHFYHEITPEELHEICLDHLDEIKLLLDRMVQAINRKVGIAEID